ncbi:MAG: DUF3160 domain-containing protein [Thermodesulfobacteriota bacterium]
MTRRALVLASLAVGLLSFILAPAPARAGLESATGMFGLYEDNRREGRPNYITEDFLVLAYSLVLDQAVTELEEKTLRPDLEALVQGLIEKLKAVRSPQAHTKANLDYLAVLAALLSGRADPVPAANPAVATEELRKIRAAAGLARSELMLQELDYSQFKVRGKYTRSERLGRYFQAVKYAGTTLFPVLESRATGITAQQADRLTAQALELAGLIGEDPKLLQAVQGFEDKLTWLFGPSEDLTYRHYYRVGREMKKAALAKVRADLLDLARQENRQPAIINAPVSVSLLEPGRSPRDVLTGWRLLPPRYTPDGAAMQHLVYAQVKDYLGDRKPFSLTVINGRPVKGFPLGLELMALLGSKAAGSRLDAADERNYAEYSKASDQARRFLNSAAGLSSEHFKLMAYWLGQGRTSPDENRRLETCLGFWTRQRYLNSLYAKQSYTLVGKGVSLGPDRPTAWIEPVPDLYQGLENLVRACLTHLESEKLGLFLDMVQKCRALAEAELAGRALTQDEVNFLNNLDLTLLPLTSGPDLPIVVDVHTEPNSGLVLEEALGPPRIVTKDLSRHQARGALFSYFEFKQPLDDRLTDEQWRAMVVFPDKIESLNLSPGSTRTTR